MKKIAIIGLGLIGGSLALALKKAGFYVIGISHKEETLVLAKRNHAIDEGSLSFKKIALADIVFICTPINLIIPKLKKIIPHLKNGGIVSDVGSTKHEIVSIAEKLMPKGTYFIGGHPMAGKEKTGFLEAEVTLFKEKTWIITKTLKTSKKALKNISKILKLTGANPLTLDTKKHDLVVAGISHMPLAISVALVNAIAASNDSELMGKCASSGFFDTTRIASGDPVLGVNIFETNKESVLKVISLFKKSLSELENLVRRKDLKGIEKTLFTAKKFRDRILD